MPTNKAAEGGPMFHIVFQSLGALYRVSTILSCGLKILVLFVFLQHGFVYLRRKQIQKVLSRYVPIDTRASALIFEVETGIPPSYRSRSLRGLRILTQ